MIFKILDRFYQFGVAEYWRSRCLQAEVQLEAETSRNREREDSLATMYVQAMGIFGIPPRRGPAQIQSQSPRAPQPLRSADPWNDLGAVDRMEFETQWLPDALAHGVPVDQAKQKFLMELAKRKTLNDGSDYMQ